MGDSKLKLLLLIKVFKPLLDRRVKEFFRGIRIIVLIFFVFFFVSKMNSEQERYDANFGLLRVIEGLTKPELELLEKLFGNIVRVPESRVYRQVKAAKIPVHLQNIVFKAKFISKVHEFEQKLCFHHPHDPLALGYDAAPWAYLRLALELVQKELRHCKDRETAAAENARKIRLEKERWNEESEKVKNHWIERKQEREFQDLVKVGRRAYRTPAVAVVKQPKVRAVNIFNLPVLKKRDEPWEE